jgi:hypothetical protein
MAITATGDNPIVVTGTTAASDDIKSSGNWVISKLYWLQPTKTCVAGRQWTGVV